MPPSLASSQASNFSRTTRRHIANNRALHSHSFKKLKSNMLILCSPCLFKNRLLWLAKCTWWMCVYRNRVTTEQSSLTGLRNELCGIAGDKGMGSKLWGDKSVQCLPNLAPFQWRFVPLTICITSQSEDIPALLLFIVYAPSAPVAMRQAVFLGYHCGVSCGKWK
jgi:hypothetical protein